jgi:hypothetical protein
MYGNTTRSFEKRRLDNSIIHHAPHARVAYDLLCKSD